MIPSPRILIVDDEEIIAKNIETSVRHLGYDVAAIVPSGEEAIQQATLLHPAIVLMDIYLERKMDGIEAAEYIRTNLDIPVIYLTAYDDHETFQRAKTTNRLVIFSNPSPTENCIVPLKLRSTNMK